jgi:hypothetical protein
MSLVETDRAAPTSSDPRIADNERLLADARADRVRHEAMLRQAERKLRDGLAMIRRATLRVISS